MAACYTFTTLNPDCFTDVTVGVYGVDGAAVTALTGLTGGHVYFGTLANISSQAQCYVLGDSGDGTPVCNLAVSVTAGEVTALVDYGAYNAGGCAACLASHRPPPPVTCGEDLEITPTSPSCHGLSDGAITVTDPTEGIMPFTIDNTFSYLIVLFNTLVGTFTPTGENITVDNGIDPPFGVHSLNGSVGGTQMQVNGLAGGGTKLITPGSTLTGATSHATAVVTDRYFFRIGDQIYGDTSAATANSQFKVDDSDDTLYLYNIDESGGAFTNEIIANNTLFTLAVVSTSGITVYTTYSYHWTGANGFTSTDQNLTGLVAGTYTLLVTLDYCQKIYTVEVTDPAVIDTDAIITDTSCNGLSDGSISLTGTESGGPEQLLGDTIQPYLFPDPSPNPYNLNQTFIITSGSGWVLPPLVQLRPAPNTGNPNCSILIGIRSLPCLPGNDTTPSTCWEYSSYSQAIYTQAQWDAAIGGVLTVPIDYNLGFGCTMPLGLFVGKTYRITIEVTYLSGNPLTDYINLVADSTNSYGLVTTSTPPVEPCLGSTPTGKSLWFSILPNANYMGGTYPYTFAWTGPNGYTSPDQNITGLAAGDYTVIITDANGCTGTKTFTVGQPSSIVVTAVVTNIICFPSTKGSITLDVSGGTPPYNNYSWTSTNGFTSTDKDISGLDAGFYTVSVTDSNGCNYVLDDIEVISPDCSDVTLPFGMTSSQLTCFLMLKSCCLGDQVYNIVKRKQKGESAKECVSKAELLEAYLETLQCWYPEGFIVTPETKSYYVMTVHDAINNVDISVNGVLLYSGTTDGSAIAAFINSNTGTTGFSSEYDGINVWIIAPSSGYNGMPVLVEEAGGGHNIVPITPLFQGGDCEVIAHPCLDDTQVGNIIEQVRVLADCNCNSVTTDIQN